MRFKVCLNMAILLSSVHEVFPLEGDVFYVLIPEKIGLCLKILIWIADE
jgi:hypothetical protein